MPAPRFDVVFTGERVPGSDLDEVRRQLATLFRADEAAIDRLFDAGVPVVIRRGVGEALAQRYQAAMRKAGAVVQVRPARGAHASPGDAAPQPLTTPSPESPASGIGSASLLPPGTPFPQPPRVSPPPFDLSGLQLAAPGSDLADWEAPPEPPAFDLSGMTLAPPGADLLETD